MHPDLIRALAPTGTDRTLVTRRGTIAVTIIEHASGAVYVGMHPSMLRVPYADILAIN